MVKKKKEESEKLSIIKYLFKHKKTVIAFLICVAIAGTGYKCETKWGSFSHDAVDTPWTGDKDKGGQK